MTLVVAISPQVDAKLRQQAAAEGQAPEAYASTLLEQALGRPSLDQLLAPLRAQFAASGTTDEQLVQQITEAQTRHPAPRRTLERATGIAKGASPPPDDATVQQWIQEHRLRKHG